MFGRAASASVRKLRSLPLVEARRGPVEVRAKHEQDMSASGGLCEALEALQARCVIPPAEEAPVFILGSAWRSGSTLVQRLVASGGECLVWGEPYDRCDLVRRMSGSMYSFVHEWPPEAYFASPSRVAPEGSAYWSGWIANLYPEVSDLVEAHREFYRRLFAAPARAAGYTAWGLKEVRLSGNEARYLKFLFPNAKIVYVVRNPYHSYISYRPKRSWYDRWPEELVATPRRFGEIWRRLTSSFIDSVDELGGLLIYYEDLVYDTETVVSQLEQFVNGHFDRDLLEDRVGSSRDTPGYSPRIPRAERRALKKAVQPLTDKLNYECRM